MTTRFAPQLWTPLVFSPQQRANYGNHSFTVVAKLKPGVTLSAAQADMERVTRGIAERQPRNTQGRGVNVRTVPRGRARWRLPYRTLRAARLRHAGAAHRMRQRREPAAGACDDSPSRDRDPRRDRWRPVANRSSAPHRKRRAGDRRRRRRCRPGVGRHSSVRQIRSTECAPPAGRRLSDRRC